MDAKTYAAAVALIMVGVGVGYVLMGPFPETTEAQEEEHGGGGQYDPPHSSQVSFLNYNSSSYQNQSFWKEGNRVTSDCISHYERVIFYDYDMNVIAVYNLWSGNTEGTIKGNSANKCSGYSSWIDTELPQEPVRVGLLHCEHSTGCSSDGQSKLRIRTF